MVSIFASSEVYSESLFGKLNTTFNKSRKFLPCELQTFYKDRRTVLD